MSTRQVFNDTVSAFLKMNNMSMRLDDITREWKEMEQSPIPYRNFGNTLADAVASIDGVNVRDGVAYLSTNFVNEDSKRILDLMAKEKPNRNKRGSARGRFGSRGGRRRFQNRGGSRGRGGFSGLTSTWNTVPTFTSDQARASGNAQPKTVTLPQRIVENSKPTEKELSVSNGDSRHKINELRNKNRVAAEDERGKYFQRMLRDAFGINRRDLSQQSSGYRKDQARSRGGVSGLDRMVQNLNLEPRYDPSRRERVRHLSALGLETSQRSIVHEREQISYEDIEDYYGEDGEDWNGEECDDHDERWDEDEDHDERGYYSDGERIDLKDIEPMTITLGNDSREIVGKRLNDSGDCSEIAWERGNAICEKPSRPKYLEITEVENVVKNPLEKWEEQNKRANQSMTPTATFPLSRPLIPELATTPLSLFSPHVANDFHIRTRLTPIPTISPTSPSMNPIFATMNSMSPVTNLTPPTMNPVFPTMNSMSPATIPMPLTMNPMFPMMNPMSPMKPVMNAPFPGANVPPPHTLQGFSTHPSKISTPRTEGVEDYKEIQMEPAMIPGSACYNLSIVLEKLMLAKAKYTTYEMKMGDGRKMYVCKIKANGVFNISTYQNEQLTANAAHELAASMAIDAFTKETAVHKKTESGKLIVERVTDMMKCASDSGLDSKFVEEKYFEKYGEDVPSNWLTTVSQNSDIQVELLLCGYVLYPPPVRRNALVSEEIPEMDFPKEVVDVKLLNVANPDNFYIQTKKGESDLWALTIRMEIFYKDKKPLVGIRMKQGECYAARHDDAFYRVVRAGNSNMFFMVDMGHFKIFDGNSIYKLDPQFKDLPKLCAKAKLHGLNPKFHDWSVVGHDGRPSDIVRFKELVEEKILQCMALELQRDNKGETVFLVKLRDPASVDDISAVFISEGRATDVPGSEQKMKKKTPILEI